MSRYRNQKSIAKSGLDLYSSARISEAEQEAVLGGAGVDQLYEEVLASYVEVKLNQVSVIEDKLETMVDRQKASLQSLRINAPGLLSMPSTRRNWQTAQTRQQERLRQLTNRLSAVRDIKDEMGLHSSKIEELATRKLRSENPELASDWDFMRETARVRQVLLRERKPAKNKKLSVGLSQQYF